MQRASQAFTHFTLRSREKRTHKAEVDQVISWLTGYGQKELETQLEKQTDFEAFFAKAPKINPSRALIKGVVCGVRVEDIKEPTMREIRYLDKLIDELAQGKTMDKILRKNDPERPTSVHLARRRCASWRALPIFFKR